MYFRSLVYFLCFTWIDYIFVHLIQFRVQTDMTCGGLRRKQRVWVAYPLLFSVRTLWVGWDGRKTDRAVSLSPETDTDETFSCLETVEKRCTLPAWCVSESASLSTVCCCLRHHFNFLWPSTSLWQSSQHFNTASLLHTAIELFDFFLKLCNFSKTNSGLNCAGLKFFTNSFSFLIRDLGQ